MSRILAILLSSILLLFFSSPAFAQQPHANSAIPERNGDYPDPEHPGVRVRVFVHEAHGPTGLSSIVCSADPDSNALVGSLGLHLPSGNWTYNLNLSSVPSSVGSGNLPTIAGNAFSQWQNALVSSSSAKPNFVHGDDTTITKSALDGKNVITWGRTLGSALAVTRYWYYPSTGLIAETDTIMNLKFPWAWSGGSLCAVSNVYDAQDILTHELGHWTGLDDMKDSSYTDNTMYAYGSPGETKKDTLTSGDINGVKAIYP